MTATATRPRSATVKLRNVTTRPGEPHRNIMGISLPTHLVRRLEWDIGDELLLRMTASGRLMVERIAEGE